MDLASSNLLASVAPLLRAPALGPVQRPSPEAFARAAWRMYGEDGEAKSVSLMPWQTGLLRSGANQLVNVTRQGGKSHTIALKALYLAIFRKRSLILIVSPSERQSTEFFKKVRGFYEDCPEEWKLGLVTSTAHSLELENGSRIVSLPNSEGKIRGYSSVALLIFDESGDVPDKIYHACRPMIMASKGQLICAGTPKGKRGWWYEAWDAAARHHFEKIEVKGSEIPWFTSEMLDIERAVLGPAFDQEYGCSFLAGIFGRVYGAFDKGRNLIAPAELPRCFDPTHADFKRAHFGLGVDYGFTDDCGFTIGAWRDNDPTVYIPYSQKQSQMDAVDAAEHVKLLMRTYDFEFIVGDEGGLGKGYAEQARARFGIPIMPADKVNKRGYIDLFNASLAKGLTKVVASEKTAQLVEEWENLPWDEERKKEKEGFADHCADSCLYMWRAMANYHEVPIRDRPAYGTKEAWEAEEAELLAKMEEQNVTPQNFWEQLNHQTAEAPTEESQLWGALTRRGY
jgi:hypothetical protein